MSFKNYFFPEVTGKFMKDKYDNVTGGVIAQQQVNEFLFKLSQYNDKSVRLSIEKLKEKETSSERLFYDLFYEFDKTISETETRQCIDEAINYFYQNKCDEPSKKYVLIQNYSIGCTLTKYEIFETDDKQEAVDQYIQLRSNLNSIVEYKENVNIVDDYLISDKMEGFFKMHILDSGYSEHVYSIYLTKTDNPYLLLKPYDYELFNKYKKEDWCNI